MKNNQILKIYGTDYTQMTKQLLVQADLKARIPGPECRIGIKPNLVSPTPACCGATTHPEVVAGLIEYLQENGFHHIMIAEGSWVGDRTAEAIEVCGYDVLAQKYGVTLRDAQKDSSHAVDCAGMELNLCDCVDEIDFLINVPVLKGHCQTKITCALKNMKGLLPNTEKRRFHAMGLHRPIAHLAAGIHQDFIVVDHICGDLDFEDGGNPVVRNCVMAACDPVLVDAYVCHLLHYEVDEVPYVRLAEQLGIGSADLAHAEIRTCVRRESELFAVDSGEKTEVPVDMVLCDMEEDVDEELPRERKIVELRDAVEEVESCSACYGYLIPALDRLRGEGLLEKLDAKICIGQGYQGRTGHIGVGRCTKNFEYNVMGCPPTEGQIYDFLKKYLSETEQG
jgi:uncharacterized protein (DUF362 family)